MAEVVKMTGNLENDSKKDEIVINYKEVKDKIKSAAERIRKRL